jgi:hypothetical protein
MLIPFLGLLQSVDAGGDVDVSEVHAASLFRIEVCRLFRSVCAYIGECFSNLRQQWTST